MLTPEKIAELITAEERRMEKEDQKVKLLKRLCKLQKDAEKYGLTLYVNDTKLGSKYLTYLSIIERK